MGRFIKNARGNDRSSDWRIPWKKQRGDRRYDGRMNDKREDNNSDGDNNDQPARVITMIVGKSVAGATTNKGKKRYAQMVIAVETTSKRLREQILAITVDQSDLERINYLHDDVLIVTLW